MTLNAPQYPLLASQRFFLCERKAHRTPVGTFDQASRLQSRSFSTCARRSSLWSSLGHDSESMTPGKNCITVRPVDDAPSIVPDEPVLNDRVGSPAPLHSVFDDVPFRSIITIAWIAIGIAGLTVFATVWLSVSS